MPGADSKADPAENAGNLSRVTAGPARIAYRRSPHFRVLPFLLTLIAVLLAGVLSWGLWQAYMAAPWTRDATVRAYVVTLAPQVAGRIVQLPVADNQLVHKGDLVMVIDPTDYAIAVDQATALVEQTEANAEDANVRRSAGRPERPVGFGREKQSYAATARAAEATYQQAVASLAKYRVDLQRQIRSPVNGYITNLLVQRGDYATVGDKDIAIVNADSFWVDGYFGGTRSRRHSPERCGADQAAGFSPVICGRVQSIARGIVVANAQPDGSGLANVNPIFTWVRLAQRFRCESDHR